MRQLLFFAAVLLVVGVFAARYADRAVETNAASQASVGAAGL
jgi:hypothetical protein